MSRVKTKEIYVVNRKFKYDGKLLERGDVWNPVGGQYDIKLVANGYVQAVPENLESFVEEVEQPKEVNPLLLKKLDNAGKSLDDVIGLPDDEILAIDGIGPKLLEMIREV